MRIWAVGGGKGGTGKSLVANGLGARLAEMGHSVVLVDADFGGANQHTYCGIRKPVCSLSRFFEDKVALADLVVDTPIEGLRLVPGAYNSPNTDSITSVQKLKLFRHLRKLDADHVILDLGAGTQYDTLDSFLLADVQLCVIIPDVLSIENFYLFLKNLQFRQLGNVLSEVGMREMARELWKSRVQLGVTTVLDFIAHLATLSDEFAQKMARKQENLAPHVVLNQVREYRQVEMALAVTSAVNKLFRVPATYSGYIRHDKELWHQFGQGTGPVHRGTSYGLKHDLEGVVDGILKTLPNLAG